MRLTDPAWLMSLSGLSNPSSDAAREVVPIIDDDIGEWVPLPAGVHKVDHFEKIVSIRYNNCHPLTRSQH